MCSSCGYEQEVFEEEAVPETEDRLQAALAAAYALFSVTCVGQIREPGE